MLVRAGRWAERLTAVPFDLLGKTVLVVGFGRTGTRVAKRCLAMEMTVIVYDPYLGPKPCGRPDASRSPISMPRSRGRIS
jgi:phosphoglycerate dehydrogenase-like enzyme